jgi:hypothetical protein
MHNFSNLFDKVLSVVGIATGYGLDGPGMESRWRARFSAPVQTDPGAHPASCTMGTGSFPGVKSGRGVTLTPHPLLVQWSRKGRAIPLLPLWAVRPVQSLSACTVELYLYSPYGPYSLYRASVPAQKCTLRVPDKSSVHHQEYLNTVYTQQVFVMLILFASASVVRKEHLDHASRRQQK